MERSDSPEACDPIHTGLIMQECMKYDCELQFVKMPLENSDTGMVILFVRGIGDKMEAVKFKNRSRRGRKSVISAGRIPNTGKPLTATASTRKNTSELSTKLKPRM